MGKVVIPANLFEMTKEQQVESKAMYSGKIVKCLVAPYHTYNELEKAIVYTPTTFLFPEREMTESQIAQLVSVIELRLDASQEVRIVTKHMAIITDMIDPCVRILTQGGNIVSSPIRTLAANIHDIRCTILENKDHQVAEPEETFSTKAVQKIIRRLSDDNKKPLSKKEHEEVLKAIGQISEELIRKSLLGMLSAKLAEL